MLGKQGAPGREAEQQCKEGQLFCHSCTQQTDCVCTEHLIQLLLCCLPSTSLLPSQVPWHQKSVGTARHRSPWGWGAVLSTWAWRWWLVGPNLAAQGNKPQALHTVLVAPWAREIVATVLPAFCPMTVSALSQPLIPVMFPQGWVIVKAAPIRSNMFLNHVPDRTQMSLCPPSSEPLSNGLWLCALIREIWSQIQLLSKQTVALVNRVGSVYWK